MKKLKYVFLATVVVFYSHTLIGQIPQINYEDFRKSNIVPPSPTASALMEYAMIPVDYYHGIPKINIPLYNIESKELSTQLSLSYHASGIKVQDIASSSGLGWVLNAGGIITRAVRGLPDDDPNGYCGVNNTSDYIYSNQDLDSYPEDKLKNVVDRNIDFEPDLFTFNVNSKTGKFVLDRDGNPVIFPFQNIKIEPAVGQNGMGYWKLTDKNGIKYYFGQVNSSRESSKYSVNGEEETTYVSSWYLDKIESPNSTDVINFAYINGSNISYSYIHRTETREIGCRNNSESENSDVAITVLSPKYLNKISFSLGEISLEYSNRTDISNSKKLDEIIVENYQGSTIKTLRFNYDYFGTSANNNLRLKLENIVDQYKSTKPLYKFNYHTTILPKRSSYDFDHWGYYNAAGNTSYYPSCTVKNISTSGGISVSGAARQPNASAAKACILTSLENLTGGITSFEYGLNKYLNENNVLKNAGGIRIISITENDLNGNLSTRTFNYNQSGTIYSEPVYYARLFNTWYEGCEYFLINRQSQSFKELFDLGGYHISYGKVTESFPDGSKKEFIFHDLQTNPDIAPENYHNYLYLVGGNGIVFPLKETVNWSWNGFPFTPYTSRYWERGLLKKESYYNSSSELVSSIENIYEFDIAPVKTVLGIKVSGYESSSTNTSYAYYYGRYKIEQKPFYLKKTIEKIYDSTDPGDEDKVQVKTTIYDYDNEHYFPKRKTFYVSDSEDDGNNVDNYITEYKYPFSYSIGSSYGGDAESEEYNGLVLLKEKHILNKVIEQVDMVKYPESDSKWVLGCAVNSFREYPLGSRKVFPYKFYVLETNEYLERKPNTLYVNFSTTHSFLRKFTVSNGMKSKSEWIYNSNTGNISQIKNYDGINTSYLWGYNNSLPTLAATNVSPDKLAYTGFEGGNNEGGWTYNIVLPNMDGCTADCSSCYQRPPEEISSCMTECYNAYYDCVESEIDNSSGIEITKDGIRTRTFKKGTIVKTGMPQGNYELSFWARKYTGYSGTLTTHTISGAVSHEFTDNSGWQYFNYTLNNISSISLNVINVLIDELKLRPVDSQITTYEHKPLVGVNKITDINDKISTYEYDSDGRLILTKDNDGNVIQHIKYQFKQ